MGSIFTKRGINLENPVGWAVAVAVPLVLAAVGFLLLGPLVGDLTSTILGS